MKEILKNNAPLKVYDDVIGALKDISDNNPNTNTFESFPEIHAHAKNIRLMIVSDSIIVHLPAPNRLITAEAITAFSMYTSNLYGALFRKMLPVRGAISQGEFVSHGNYFAGKVLIDCYSKSESLNFSGIVATGELSKRIEKELLVIRKNNTSEFSFNEMYKVFFHIYDCPINMDKQERCVVLDTNISTQDEKEPLEQIIYDSFAGHNKNVGPNVYKKILNTTMLNRFFISKAKEK